MPTKQKLATKPLVTLSDVSVTYPSGVEPAVEHISFMLLPGTISMLVGPNGSGKSTVIKSILGTMKHTGRIFFSSNSDGKNSQSLSRPNTNHQVGYLPQRFEFDHSLPLLVSEFLFLSLLTCSHSNILKKSMIQKVLEQVGGSKLVDSRLGTLSGGQLQRILLARALLHQPQLLILDEPEAGIDSEGELSLYELLRHLATEHNYAILVASHELQLVSTFADQVLCINKRLVCQGKPSEVLNETVFKELYGTHQRLYTHHHSAGATHVH